MPAIEHRTGAKGDYAWPPLINFLLGLGILLSASLWPHGPTERMQAWVLGGAITVVSAWAMFAHAVHYVDAALGGALLLTTFNTWHASSATVWLQAPVGAIVFVLALVPNTWNIVIRRRR